MPLQNRVTPLGEIIATSARGTTMGNRGGCFHDGRQRLKGRHWSSRSWICCKLEFKGRRRPLMSPGKYTELFFLDEATALSAGHRPCFECRRAEADIFAELFAKTILRREPRAQVSEMDAVLHGERMASAPSPTAHTANAQHLPRGIFVLLPTGPAVHLGDAFFAHWTPHGYTTRQQVLKTVTVLTPPAIASVIAEGYKPGLHASAY